MYSMKCRVSLLTLLPVLILAGCGVSPRVRVEPSAAGDTPPSAGASAGAGSASLEGARTRHVVVRGDTLYSIAFRNGLDVRDLIDWNRIAPPYTIFPGQALQLSHPHRDATSLDPTLATAAEPVRSTASVTPVARPAAENGLGPRAIVDDASIAQAQPLVESTAPLLDAGSRPAPGQPGSLIAAISEPPKPPSGTAMPTPGFKPESTAANGALPATAVVTAAATSAPVQTGATQVAAAIVDSSGATAAHQGLSWRWPTAGQVIGRFVAGDPTQRGIDITGSLGQPVLAVGDGEVVYSGNGLLGYGEMIIVQHSPDYLSAYGHNQRRLVNEGSKVKSGQRIAEMGQRGSTVMLHFEIRLRGKPVDPLGYLPR